MRRIENYDNPDILRYQLDDGRWLNLERYAVERFGLTEVMRRQGLSDQIPTKRVDLYQEGRLIGTMAPDFDPSFIKSQSWMYSPRPGDFKHNGDHWIASDMLCPSDFEAIPGFRWGPDAGRTDEAVRRDLEADRRLTMQVFTAPIEDPQ